MAFISFADLAAFFPHPSREENAVFVSRLLCNRRIWWSGCIRQAHPAGFTEWANGMDRVNRSVTVS